MDDEFSERFGYPPFYESIEEYDMPDKRQFLNSLELEERITNMSDRELMEFTARQTYDVCLQAGSNELRIASLEKRSNTFIGLIGAAGAFVGAIIITIVNYFASR